MTLEDLQDRFEEVGDELRRLEGGRDALKETIREHESELRRLRNKQEHATEAQKIIQLVAQRTQEELKYRISQVATTALDSVFPNPYEFHLDFVVKRGKTEAVPSFVRQGSPTQTKLDPLLETGGGVVDVAAFALRLCLWNLARHRTRNLFLLDEPFKFVSRDLISKVGALLREAAERLELQLVIITHDKAIAGEADQAYVVRLEETDGHQISNVLTEAPALLRNE